MPLSQNALRFVANNTENRYELGICVDQLGDCAGVKPKVALPLDWVHEALRAGVAKATFAARYCDDAATLSTLVTRERRARVQQALASNPHVSKADFRELLTRVGGADRNRAYTIRELESLRRSALRKLSVEQRRQRVPAVAPVTGLDTLLDNPRTYTTKTVSSVMLALRGHAGEEFAVDNLLRREVEAGEHRFALAYLKDYYITPSAHADVWARCVLSPAEVVSLHAKAKRVILLTKFMNLLAPVAKPQRALDADITALIIDDLSAGRFARRTTYRASEKFTPAAIDVLLGDRAWNGILWDHVLSDEQFSTIASDPGSVNKYLLLNLMGSGALRLAVVLVAAWKSVIEGSPLFYKMDLVSLERKFSKVPADTLHELIESTPVLAYMLITNPLFSEYIYQRLATSGLPMLDVLEAFETNWEMPLGKFLENIAAVELID
jgi:hypothetical protein